MTTGKDSGADALILNSPKFSNFADTPDNWHERRVLVVSVHNTDVIGDGKPTPGSPMGILQGELRRLGYSLDDVADRIFYGAVAEFAWPRNVRWKALPVIGDPAYKTSFSGTYLFSEEEGLDFRQSRGPTHRPGLSGGSAEMLIVATDVVDPKDLYELDALFREEHPGRERKFMHFNGEILRNIGAEEIAAAYEKHYPNDRFVYNHVVNLLVIGGRANLKAARDRGESQWHLAQFAPRLHDFHWRFGHPLCIQMLYAIGRSSEGVPTSWFREEPQEVEWLWGNRSDFFRKEGDSDVFQWTGTGNYPAWVQVISPAISEFAEKGAKVQRSYLDTAAWWMSALNFGDFVCLNENGRVCLSAKGRNYLGLLGSGLYDQDVLLRWRTSDGRFCEMKDVPAVDRWLNRAFRKVKRAVANLPESQIDEDYEAGASERWSTAYDNIFAIRGWRMAVTDEMMLDEGFAAEVAEIEKTQQVLPIASWRAGVIRDEVGFGECGKVVALWAGAPLGIFAERHTNIGRYELLADWRALDNDIASNAVPSCFVKDGDEARMHVFWETQRRAEVFYKPERLMERDGNTWPVIRGRVLRLSVPIEDKELAEAVSQRKPGWAIASRGPDGIKVFGSQKDATRKSVSIGIQVGAYDPATQSLAMTTTWAKYRSDRIDWMLSTRGRNGLASLVLEHADTSDDGYWIMRPDGQVIELKVEKQAE